MRGAGAAWYEEASVNKKSRSKLSLRRETVSVLSAAHLRRAAGGVPTVDTNCLTCWISCGGTCIDFSCVCNPSWDCPDH